MQKKIISTALQMAKSEGLINLSRPELCKRVGISEGSFTYHMGCSFTKFTQNIKPLVVENNNIKVVNKKRVTDPTLRKEHILNVAINTAKIISYDKLTRQDVAENAGVSIGLITRYFTTMNQLRRDVMRTAVKRGVLEVVAQGLVNKDKHALKASKELKANAANLIANY